MDTKTARDDMLAQMCALAGTGWSASEIAKEFGVTRATVIGKLWRSGFRAGKPSPTIPRRPARAPRAPRAAPKIEPPMITEPKPTPPQKQTREEIAAFDAIDPSPHRGAGEACAKLTSHQCRWPIGDPLDEEFRFCCHTVHRIGAPYCKTHRNVARVILSK